MSALQLTVPKIWRKAKLLAILKPGKDPAQPKSYRPISLLCHTYKLYERLILNRLSPVVEKCLIDEQAGFRRGKSCTNQILNLTQYTEDGFENNYHTGVVFVDLSAAYDTLDHRRLLEQLYDISKDFRLVKMVRTLLENRRFYVDHQDTHSQQYM